MGSLTGFRPALTHACLSFPLLVLTPTCFLSLEDIHALTPSCQALPVLGNR